MGGLKIVEGMDELLAIARGEKTAARVHLNGKVYVPEDEIVRLRAENERLRGLLHEAWAMLQVWDEPRENDLCIRIERTLAGAALAPIAPGSEGTATPVTRQEPEPAGTNTKESRTDD